MMAVAVPIFKRHTCVSRWILTTHKYKNNVHPQNDDNDDAVSSHAVFHICHFFIFCRFYNPIRQNDKNDKK